MQQNRYSKHDEMMCNISCMFNSWSGIRNQYCCLFMRAQDSQWFKSCLSTTVAVCQAISQALSLEAHTRIHPYHPPSLTTYPALCVVSALIALPFLSLFFTSIFAHLTLSQLHPHILLYRSSFIFTYIWTTIYLLSNLSLFYHPSPT